MCSIAHTCLFLHRIRLKADHIMGCSSSIAEETAQYTQIRGVTPRILLDQEKKDIIRKSWKLVEPVKKVAGRKMFMR